MVHTAMHTATEHLTISAVIQSCPGDFPGFSFLAAFSFSSPKGASMLTARVRNSVFGISGASAGGGLFNNFSKCVA